MDRDSLIRLIQEEVLRRLTAGTLSIPVAVSSRHVHLCEADARRLLGDQPLSKLRDLSQPGEFAANETVTLVGPRGVIERVRVLGPLRRRTQVEVSQTDALRLGIEPPVRDSGLLDGSAGVTLVGQAGAVTLSEGAILALRHVHMTPEDAARFGVADKQIVSVRLGGQRSLTLGGVIVRVSPNYRLELHLDTDEANAGLVQNGDQAEILAGDPAGSGDSESRHHAEAVPALHEAPAPEFTDRALTARTVSDLLARGIRRVAVPPQTIVTALAQDLARDKGIEIERR